MHCLQLQYDRLLTTQPVQLLYQTVYFGIYNRNSSILILNCVLAHVKLLMKAICRKMCSEYKTICKIKWHKTSTYLSLWTMCNTHLPVTVNNVQHPLTCHCEQCATPTYLSLWTMCNTHLLVAVNYVLLFLALADRSSLIVHNEVVNVWNISVSQVACLAL